MEKGYYKNVQEFVRYDERDIEHKDEKGNLLYTEHIKEPIYETRQEWVEYTQTELYENEHYELKKWFDNTYTYKEQKYRRLIALNKLDDDGVDGQTKLNFLYQEAEEKRARIQELEKLLNF